VLILMSCPKRRRSMGYLHAERQSVLKKVLPPEGRSCLSGFV